MIKNELITFKFNKSNNKRKGLFKGFTKDNKYCRIAPLNPYIGIINNIVRIPRKLITVINK